MKLGDLMNPHQYAIEVLDKIEFVRGKLPDGVNDVEEVLNLSIKALEKQIPKKPMEVSTEYNEFICMICPSCQEIAVEFDDRFCRRCGQAIDWSEE